MRKILLVLTMVMSTIFANAQQLEPNYHYSFWSNWSIGAGAVYSKPADFTNWTFDNGANIGIDVRLEKPLSDYWTLRLDATIPGLKNTGVYDRYGTAMGGMELNLGRYFYLFGDAGLSFAKFGSVSDKNVHFAGDAGIGSHIYLTDNTKLYVEVGSDCVAKVEKPNANLFGKIGVMTSLGVTEKDRQNISILHNQQNGVNQTEYDKLVAEKNECAIALQNAIQDLNNMRNCCQANNAKYEKEIADLKVALANSDDLTVPFSILFDKNSTNLSNVAKEIIAQVAVEMNKNGGTYTLYGFGDYTGTETYNEVLSQSRCESVKAELVRKGVQEDKINVVGLGKTKYFGTAESYINRRVMFVKD